jgi:hypothetical protein
MDTTKQMKTEDPDKFNSGGHTGMQEHQRCPPTKYHEDDIPRRHENPRHDLLTHITQELAE